MDSIFNTRADYFLSRFLHMLSAGLLIGTAAVPLLYKHAELVYPKFFMIAAAVVAFTGLYNASVLQPGRMKEAATLYRIVVYAGKGSLLALMSPLLDKLFPGPDVSMARFGIVVLSVALGTWCRYYREKNTPPRSSA